MANLCPIGVSKFPIWDRKVRAVTALTALLAHAEAPVDADQHDLDAQGQETGKCAASFKFVAALRVLKSYCKAPIEPHGINEGYIEGVRSGRRHSDYTAFLFVPCTELFVSVEYDFIRIASEGCPSKASLEADYWDCSVSKNG